MRKNLWIVFGALALLAVPAAASHVLIESGIDVWWTPNDGSTRADFQQEPIPAGFFCPDSRPFLGSITFGGVPIATTPKGTLRGADTVIYRLDDVSFEGPGEAYTRIQVAALSLASLAPVKTRCGRFAVHATLAGEQPVTLMTIVRDEEKGGSFSAPLALDVRLTFKPLDERSQRPLTLVRRVELDPAPDSRWLTEVPGRTRQATGFVTIDADGDGRPETSLPGTSSSFFADAASATRGWVCHSGSGHQHCYFDCPDGEYICEQ